MTVDWDGLKALEANSTRDPYLNHSLLMAKLAENFPAILAAHERDQRVIEAAEKLLQGFYQRPCSGPDCIDWKCSDCTCGLKLWDEKITKLRAEFDKEKQA